MKVRNIGLQINTDRALDEAFKTYQEKSKFHLMDGTDFNVGIVAFEDVFLLPHGTFVIVYEHNNKSFIGKICRYQHVGQSFKNTKYSTAIVPYYYDIESVTYNQLIHNKNNIKSKIYNVDVNVYLRKPSGRIIQCVDLEYDDNDEWDFVKICYGNYNIKMNYTYGWQYQNDMVYQEKSLNSDLSNIYNEYNPVCLITQESFSKNKRTDIKYTKPMDVVFVPFELELYIVYMCLFCVFFIFQARIVAWIILTILMLVFRKKIRKPYQ